VVAFRVVLADLTEVEVPGAFAYDVSNEGDLIFHGKDGDIETFAAGACDVDSGERGPAGIGPYWFDESGWIVR
jgi:hypothetical protein